MHHCCVPFSLGVEMQHLMNGVVLGAQEMQENMEVVRDVWGMQLDATRNRIIRIELLVAVASLSLMAFSVPGALFGMCVPARSELRLRMSLRGWGLR